MPTVSTVFAAVGPAASTVRLQAPEGAAQVDIDEAGMAKADVALEFSELLEALDAAHAEALPPPSDTEEEAVEPDSEGTGSDEAMVEPVAEPGVLSPPLRSPETARIDAPGPETAPALPRLDGLQPSSSVSTASTTVPRRPLETALGSLAPPNPPQPQPQLSGVVSAAAEAGPQPRQVDRAPPPADLQVPVASPRGDARQPTLPPARGDHAPMAPLLQPEDQPPNAPPRSIDSSASRPAPLLPLAPRSIPVHAGLATSVSAEGSEWAHTKADLPIPKTNMPAHLPGRDLSGHWGRAALPPPSIAATQPAPLAAAAVIEAEAMGPLGEPGEDATVEPAARAETAQAPGKAPATDRAADLRAPAAPVTGVAREAVRIAADLRPSEIGDVTIHLDPPELGRVRIVVAVREGDITVLLSPERSETADLFRRHSGDLGQDLARHGFQSRVTVEDVPAAEESPEPVGTATTQSSDRLDIRL